MLPGMTANRTRYAAGAIDVISRGEFLREFGEDYGNGQHATFIGPTQRGKTTLALAMLQKVISPQRKTIVLAGKPPKRDHTMNSAAEKLNLRITETWPPSPAIPPSERQRRNGWVLRPHQTLTDLDADTANMKAQFRKGMLAAYASQEPIGKPCVLFVDEAHLIQNDLGLKAEYEAPLTRGAPDCAVWSLIQRGRYITYHAYSAPEHLIIFRDPDVSNIKRYAELIGGVDPVFITNVVTQLRMYRVRTGGTISEALYIRRSGPELSVIDVR
jgi:energy-coupling factor transporter ATP-binding protein EcfA2